MFSYVLKKIVGTKNEREIKRLRPLVARVAELEPRMKALRDEDFARLTAECIALVSGLIYSGDSMTAIAKRHGISIYGLLGGWPWWKSAGVADHASSCGGRGQSWPATSRCLAGLPAGKCRKRENEVVAAAVNAVVCF